MPLVNRGLVTHGASACSMTVTHPSPAADVAVTGTGSQDLDPTNGGYTPVLNIYQPGIITGSLFTQLADGRVQVNRPALLDVSGYADVAQTANNSTVGLVFSVERGGVINLSPRSVHSRMPNQGDIGNISGHGLLEAQVGDIVGLHVASDKTGGVSFVSSNLIFREV